MGLLDQLGGLLGGSGDNADFSQIMQWAEQEGGLTGLLDKLKEGGLSETVQSWIGTGENLPISTEQIQQILGSETVQNLAAKVGVDPAQATELVSQYLPNLVNKLTPDGNEASLGNAEGLLGAGLDFLKKTLS